MYFRTVCNHRSYVLWKSVSPENPGQKFCPLRVVARIFIITLSFFFFSKKEEEKKLFERISKRVRVRTNGALVRLKLIQRRVIIPEFLTFHDPLVQDPRNLLGNCVKFRAIYRRFGPRVSIFFFSGPWIPRTLLDTQFRRSQRNPSDGTEWPIGNRGPKIIEINWFNLDW